MSLLAAMAVHIQKNIWLRAQNSPLRRLIEPRVSVVHVWVLSERWWV